MPTSFLLAIHFPDGAVQERIVTAGSYAIGRDPECDIVVESEHVSRHHARLILSAHDCQVVDLGSTAGTSLNGKAVIVPVPVPYPATLDLGEVSIRVDFAVDDATISAPGGGGFNANPDAPVPFVFGRRIAKGGMGAILEAQDCKVGRTIAVKIMLEEHLDGEEAQSHRQRFINEAAVLGRLEHPNIVPIHDLGRTSDGELYYTMKLVKGRTLKSILSALRDGDVETCRQYTLDRLLTIFRKVCDAMAFAHSHGIIHRDLKPDNIMAGEFGEVLVMDWGLAKNLHAAAVPASLLSLRAAPRQGGAGEASGTDFGMTMEGEVVGTPQYMCPEQADGRIADMDARSDVFSLGGILYTILTLRPPVVGHGLNEILRNVATGNITSPTVFGTSAGKTVKLDKGGGKPGKAGDDAAAPLPHCDGGRVPAALSAVAMKALSVEREKRYQNVMALSTDIEAYQGGFATTAEQAGAVTQIKLLMLRHKAVTVALSAMVLLTAGFVLKVVASERKATFNAEETRRALAVSQIAVAEAAFRGADLPAMVQALDSVPADLRDQRWEYLSVKRDASLGDLTVPGFKAVAEAKAIPDQPGQFAVANRNGHAAVIDVRSGAVLRRMKTGLKGNPVLAVSPDCQRLAVCASDAAEIKLYRLADGTLEKAVSAPGKGVAHMAFSPDGQSLAVADFVGNEGNESALALLDLRDGSIRWRYPGTYLEAIFSPGGKRLFAGTSRSRYLRMLDAATGKLLRETREYVHSMAINRSGDRLAMGLYDGEVVLVDTTTGDEVRRARLHPGNVSAVMWTAGDHLLTVGGEGGFEKGRLVMRLWETKSFSVRGTFFGLDESRMAAEPAFHPLSGHLITPGASARLWRLPVDLEVARFTSRRAEQGWSTGFVNETTLMGRADYKLQLYDVSNPRAPRTLPTPFPEAYVMTAPYWRGDTVAVARRITGPPRSVKLYDTSGGKMEEKLDMPMDDWTLRMDFNPSGTRLIAVTPNHGSVVFDTGSGKPVLKLPQKMERAVFTGNGELIAGVVAKKRLADEVEDEVTIFDAADGHPLQTRLYRHRLNELVASPDRRLIAIGGVDQTLRVLDAGTLEERHAFRAHDAEITTMAFHPTEPLIASASIDGSLKLWDYASAKARHVFMGFEGTPVMIAFSPGGRLMSVESQEHTQRLFDLAGESLPAAVKPLVRLPVPKDADGWQDLLAALTDDDLMDEGNGWAKDNGTLQSPSQGGATVALPGEVTASNYELKIKLRQRQAKEVFHLILPVGTGMVGFDLDGAPFNGHYTGLVQVDGKWGKNLPGTLQGKQITDDKPHDLDVKVQVNGADASLSFQLDGRPLYAWSGSAASLAQLGFWKSPPHRIAFGVMSDNWEVLAVRFREDVAKP